MEDSTEIDCKCDLDLLQDRLLKFKRDKWWREASEKPMLRTLMKICDRFEIRSLIGLIYLEIT